MEWPEDSQDRPETQSAECEAISQLEGGEEKKLCSDVQEVKEFLTQPQSFNVLCLSGF